MVGIVSNDESVKMPKRGAERTMSCINPLKKANHRIWVFDFLKKESVKGPIKGLNIVMIAGFIQIRKKVKTYINTFFLHHVA